MIAAAVGKVVLHSARKPKRILRGILKWLVELRDAISNNFLFVFLYERFHFLYHLNFAYPPSLTHIQPKRGYHGEEFQFYCFGHKNTYRSSVCSWLELVGSFGWSWCEKNWKTGNKRQKYVYVPFFPQKCSFVREFFCECKEIPGLTK